MVKDTEALLIIAAIAAGLYIYSDVKSGVSKAFSQPPVSLDRSESLLTKGGYDVMRTQDNELAVSVPGGVVYVPDNAPLRRWETGLLWLDKFVPGTWLSRSVLQ